MSDIVAHPVMHAAHSLMRRAAAHGYQSYLEYDDQGSCTLVLQSGQQQFCQARIDVTDLDPADGDASLWAWCQHLDHQAGASHLAVQA